MKNIGFSKACNQGAKASKYDYYIFLNPDTILEPNNLTMLRKNINVHPNSIISISQKDSKGNKKFPYGQKINFNSIRKGEVIGEHEVTFSNGKEIIKLNHEAFDRTLYSEGAITAAKWLINKKPGLYSMRNLLNFK